MKLIPRHIFLTRGVGVHKENLQSFELALRDAGIQICNLVTVSSILPPDCKVITQEEGLKHIEPGQIVYTVLSKNATNEYGRLITASIAIAQPADFKLYGYISEHHSFGQTEKETSDYTEDLAVSMLASTMGLRIPKDELEYDEIRDVYLLPKNLVTTQAITRETCGVRNKWSTVLAAAVFLF